jgi:hypothetical protein
MGRWFYPPWALVLLALAGVFACSGEKAANRPESGTPDPGTGLPGPAVSGPAVPVNFVSLDELAEAERSRGFTPGMALAESAIREWNGDYAGAVIAAFKELSWSYGYGGISRQSIAEGLEQLMALFSGDETAENAAIPGPERERAVKAARGALAFLAGEWEKAGELLSSVFAAEEEPDAFSQWMILVCAMEGEEPSRRIRAAYGAIRARYALFPEYWFRAARYALSGTSGEYAERCINLAPQGPFADLSRVILAESAGLSSQDGPALKSRTEIERVITQSVSAVDPELLGELFPLLDLPDNPYTLYATGALRALASQGGFKAYFVREASRKTGRLAERLLYVSRG